jgi:hypothetical protein
MQSEWKISKIGEQFKLTNGSEVKKLKNAEQVVMFCQKLNYIPQGIENIPAIYRKLITNSHASKK